MDKPSNLENTGEQTGHPSTGILKHILIIEVGIRLCITHNYREYEQLYNIIQAVELTYILSEQ